MNIPPLPDGYTVTYANERVDRIDPDMFTRFRWRADRRARKLNAEIIFPSYRWEVVDWLNGKWAVVAMQNRLTKETL